MARYLLKIQMVMKLFFFLDPSDLIEAGVPKIRIYPAGSDPNNRITMVASDRLFDGYNQTYVQYTVNGINDDITDPYTYLVAFESGCSIGVFGPSEAYFQSRNESLFGLDANLRIVGRWLNDTQISSTDALYTGTRSVSAGVSSVTITYPSAFATTVAPVIGLLNSAGALNWCLTAQSASSFTVAWTGTLAKEINMWNIRI